MDDIVQLPDKLLSRISLAIKELEPFQDVRVISHYDADGISAGGIVCKALLRANKRFHATITKNLTEKQIDEVSPDCKCIIFSDMGSSFLDKLETLPCKVIVLDHHQPPRDSEKVIHVNPHLAGIDGMTAGCAASVCMLFAVTMDEINWDMLSVAFGGITGDRQTIRGLSGINQWLFQEGRKRGLIEAKKGSLIPDGPVLEGLITSTEPYIIGVSGNEAGAEAMLDEAKLPKDTLGSKMNEEDRRRLVSLIALKLTEQGTPFQTMEEVMRDRYYFPKQDVYAGDLASLYNSCGRSGNESIGLAMAMGDRSALEDAKHLRAEYYEDVLKSLNKVVKNGVTKRENVQYFYNEDLGLSGILCGITMQYFGDRDKPTITLSVTDNEVRVSSRGTFEILDKGVDLAEALRECSKR